MKLILTKSMRLLFPALLISIAATAGYSQDARLQISALDRLEPRASQVVDVSIDGRLLQIAIGFLNPKNPEHAKVRDVVAGLKGVYVKSYEFEKPDEYSPADLAAINSQLKGPGWSRMVGIRRARDKETLEVYTMLVGDKIGGIAVIAAEPKQLTVVNIIGPIDLEKLSALEGNFGIPRLEIKGGDAKDKGVKP